LLSIVSMYPCIHPSRLHARATWRCASIHVYTVINCIYCYPLYPCIHVPIPLGYTHGRPGGVQASMYLLLSIVSIVIHVSMYPCVHPSWLHAPATWRYANIHVFIVIHCIHCYSIPAGYTHGRPGGVQVKIKGHVQTKGQVTIKGRLYIQGHVKTMEHVKTKE